MDEQAGARVVISGKVQGVFFRVETQRAARQFNITGWVRNRSDGTVEALLEGTREDVGSLISWCHKGAPRSRVDRVDVEWKPHTGKFVRFDITQ
ncbi:MAG: acylphosphatase [Deltaproteobacteria bacterium]|nr:MAG: acylphosphatase [Deltaproteobacteria bacterium]